MLRCIVDFLQTNLTPGDIVPVYPDPSGSSSSSRQTQKCNVCHRRRQTQYPPSEQKFVQVAQNSLKKSSFLITASSFPSHLSHSSKKYQSQGPCSLAFLEHSFRKHLTFTALMQYPDTKKSPELPYNSDKNLCSYLY